MLIVEIKKKKEGIEPFILDLLEKLISRAIQQTCVFKHQDLGGYIKKCTCKKYDPCELF